MLLLLLCNYCQCHSQLFHGALFSLHFLIGNFTAAVGTFDLAIHTGLIACVHLHAFEASTILFFPCHHCSNWIHSDLQHCLDDLGVPKRRLSLTGSFCWTRRGRGTRC